MTKIIPVILAGGVGARLWPLSRDALPKQLLPLVNEKTMLQNTYQRAQLAGVNMGKTIIVANQEYRFLIAEQMLELNEQPTIILEAIGRNTAPAIAVAAFKILQEMDDGILFVLPADHVVTNEAELQKKVLLAAELAKQNFLVTFGIQPTYPATDYGYIKYSDQVLDSSANHIDQFVEKPDITTAQTYLQAGHYLWNSGMFVFKASAYLQELQYYAPIVFEVCQRAVKNSLTDLDFFRLNETAMLECPSESIDYLIMEKTKQGVVLSVDIGWSDVGSWESLYKISKKDVAGNVLLGDAIQFNTENCYLRSESRLLATVGIKDSIIVETPDAVLALHKDYAKDIKNLVTHLSKRDRIETKLNRCVYRPWGWYETLIESKNSKAAGKSWGKGFKVKGILVKPGAALSLQLHHHRSEHWIIVSGIATVVCGEEEMLLSAGTSTYIAANTKHRLSNQQKEPLYIIEVQCGEYLEEDDIIRFADMYDRRTEDR